MTLQLLKNLLLKQNLKPLELSYLPRSQNCLLPLQKMKPLELKSLPQLQSCWLLLRN